MDATNEPSGASTINKNSMIGFENNKQFNNNPLKDISTTIMNTKPSSKVSNSGNVTSRHSMPF